MNDIHSFDMYSTIPFAFTQSEFRFGRAAWSLKCSIVSGGSWYIKLLDLLLRPVFDSLILRYWPVARGGFVLASYETVRGRRSGEDSLAVFEEEMLKVLGRSWSV